jgi:nucleotide-binding universal stress UspA family protein
MSKHLLITVSDQQSALYGIRFAGNLFSNKHDLNITLYYTIPRGPQVWSGERNHESVSEAELQAKKYEGRGRKALAAAKKELIKMGFDDAQIENKLQKRRFSKVKDIIQEGADGLYDAVVLGRRGLSWLLETFEESVTKKILEEKSNFPIWICRKPDPAKKGILVCVDGSEASMRIVDHVGFMLAGEKDQHVTLLSVKTPGKNLKDRMETPVEIARDVLIDNGFPAEQIKSKIVEDSNVVRPILKEVKDGGFSAVAVGRTGAGQGLLGKIFMGSVSSRLFRELEDASLWICY